jgi:hypothetical protein
LYVCSYFKRHDELILRNGWIKEDYYIVLDNILNNRVKYINDIECLLDNKSLEEIILMLRELKIKGIKLQLKFVCDNCGKEYYKSMYRYDSSVNHLCSTKCSREWYAKVISQTDEHKEKMRDNALNMLSNGQFAHTDTNIQIKIDKLLNELNIINENEYNCGIASMDNALFVNDKILFIECNGSYWHADNRFYSKINYIAQKDRIKHDKIKHTYVKNKYGIEILYLWEHDILNNIELCRKLILEYINNSGLLDNYHSFNYSIIDNILTINKNIIVPYMDYSKNLINNIIDLSVKERKEYWISTTCDCCNLPIHQLISEYNKHEYHFCGYACSSKFMGNIRKNKNKIIC